MDQHREMRLTFGYGGTSRMLLRLDVLAALGYPQTVELFYDAQQRTIAIRRAPDDAPDEDVLHVSYTTPAQSTALVSVGPMAYQICRDIGWDLEHRGAIQIDLSRERGVLAGHLPAPRQEHFA